MGPMTVITEKTRIAIQVRMSFTSIMLKQRLIDEHIVLAGRVDSPRFRRIESISTFNHVRAFQLCSIAEIDAELIAWLTEAYQAGEPRHLRSSTEGPGS